MFIQMSEAAKLHGRWLDQTEYMFDRRTFGDDRIVVEGNSLLLGSSVDRWGLNVGALTYTWAYRMVGYDFETFMKPFLI